MIWTQWDHALLRRAADLRRPWLDPWMRAWTRAGNWQTWITLLGLGLLAGAEVRAMSLAVAPRVLGTWGFCLIAKRLINRRRPDKRVSGHAALMKNPDPYSFPSSHTACSWVACIGLARAIAPFAPWALPFLTFHALAISLSRVYVGAHFPSDVLGGWIIALVALAI
jgi:undecaprenyl-diphosphatase